MEVDLKSLIIMADEIANTFSDFSPIPIGGNAVILAKWYKQEVEQAAFFIGQAENKLDIISSCHEGCSYCCNQLIEVTATEALMITTFMKTLDKELQSEVKKNIFNVCVILTQNSIVDINYAKETDQTEIAELNKKYFSLKVPCPLLKNNRCSIYPVRPSLCWSYKYYGDSLDCAYTYAPPESVKFCSWESIVFSRLIQARSSKRETKLLPYGLRELF